MQRHKWGTYAGGVAGLQDICEIVNIGIDPESDPVTYEAVGTDLDAKPIESGFGSTEWRWNVMSQADYELLLAKQGDAPGTLMTVRTQKRSGASGIDFANYYAMVGRPVFGRREGLVVYEVRMPLTRLVVI